MPMLLAIRSVDDLRSAIAAANGYLAIQRGQIGSNEEEGRVLGVWLRDDVDAGLPRMSCHDLVSWKAESVTGEKPRPTPVDTVSGFRIGESTSLSGIWALCWIYGTFVNGAADPLQRMRSVVDGLVSPYSTNDRGFFPVFPKGASPDSVKSAMRELREQYPNLIAKTWFIDDWNEGLIEAARGEETG